MGSLFVSTQLSQIIHLKHKVHWICELHADFELWFEFYKGWGFLFCLSRDFISVHVCCFFVDGLRVIRVQVPQVSPTRCVPQIQQIGSPLMMNRSSSHLRNRLIIRVVVKQMALN